MDAVSFDDRTPFPSPPPAGEAKQPIIIGGAPFDEQTQTDFVALLEQAVALLCLYVLHLLFALRRLGPLVAELRRRVHHWQTQYQQSCQREEQLTLQLQQAHAQIRELEHRLHGPKSETAAATGRTKITKSAKRKRGQQPGQPGPGRRDHDHLPTQDEPRTLPAEQTRCACCGQPYEPISGTLDGHILEIEVRAHRRRYQRQRYRRRCACAAAPVILTAPPPDKLIPKSGIGISLWVEILCRKFQFFTPLHRLLAELRGHGLSLSSGAITGGLQKLVPLFEPLYRHLVEHNRLAGHWHCDETRWPVFAPHPGKTGFFWNLWVFAAHDSVVFVLDPTRAHDVPEDHFGWGNSGILNVDRYSAYKAMRQVKAGELKLAFCWAHVRRDFLEVLTSWQHLGDWACSWVEQIGQLFQRNHQRLAVRDDQAAFAKADRSLRRHLERIRQRCANERALPDLHRAQRKVLNSLHNHWEGLTLFVDHLDVPLDNNTAERAHRGPVVGRKNFYGSGSLWSGRLAAMLFSLFQTVQLGQLNVTGWLTAYLTACAKAGGEPPSDYHLYLPWNLTAEQRRQMGSTTSQPAHETSPAA
jgi:transposase